MAKADPKPTTTAPADACLGAAACGYMQICIDFLQDHLHCVDLLAGQAAAQIADDNMMLERGLLASVRGLSTCFDDLKKNFAKMQVTAPWNPNVKVPAAAEGAAQ